MVQGATTTTGTNPSNGTALTATATCPAGKVVLGGGASLTPTSGANATRVTLRSTIPTATGWQATAVVTANFTGGGTASLTAFAICATVS
jgi:hypothetical protein